MEEIVQHANQLLEYPNALLCCNAEILSIQPRKKDEGIIYSGIMSDGVRDFSFLISQEVFDLYGGLEEGKKRTITGEHFGTYAEEPIVQIIGYEEIKHVQSPYLH